MLFFVLLLLWSNWRGFSCPAAQTLEGKKRKGEALGILILAWESAALLDAISQIASEATIMPWFLALFRIVLSVLGV